MGIHTNIEATLENAARPPELLLFQFPLRISQEVVDIDPVPSNIIFEAFSLASLKLV
jgi:hypothetical protein